jgi:8-oxo-dGTP diphosphatase
MSRELSGWTIIRLGSLRKSDFNFLDIIRTRAGIVLIENDKVALIEHHRAGLDYYVFPGGGVDEGETPEPAAVREAKKELGVDVVVRQKVVVIHFDLSTQIYFLVERVSGEFGTGAGEEFTDADPHDPQESVYVPVRMIFLGNILYFSSSTN